jgi:FkbM family methyltransferase
MVKFYDTRVGRYFREYKNKRLFDSLLPGDIAIDCGANIGSITKRMAKPGVRVYAFEPDPNAFEALTRNMASFKNVTVFNKAVSDHNGTAKIYFSTRYAENPEKWSTGSSLLAEKSNVDKNNFTMCELVDLSEFIQSLDKPIALLKMDIEGEEVKVLNKLIDTGMIKNIKQVVVETHERIPELKVSTEVLRQKIKKLGLKNIDLNWA